MSGSDWIRHPGSTNNYTVGLDGEVPVGGGVNSLHFHGGVGSAYKRDFYYNRYVNNVSGNQELSCAIMMDGSCANVRAGLFATWDAIDLDDTEKSYMCYLHGLNAFDIGTFISNGPAETGTVLAGPGSPLVYINWYQLLFQMKFDQVGNLELRAAISNAQITSVNTPSYTLRFPEIIIPSGTARRSGKFGFFVDSRQENFDVYVDHVSVSTQLTAL